MSRSRKKVAGWKDRNPFMKNYANRRIRRASVDTEFPEGSSYKKYTDQYSVCDYKFLHYNEKQLRDWHRRTQRFPWCENEPWEKWVYRYKMK